MTIDFSIISIICLCAAIAFAAVSVLLFIRLHIREVFNFLTGRTQKLTIEKIDAEQAQKGRTTAKPQRMTPPSTSEKLKMAANARKEDGRAAADVPEQKLPQYPDSAYKETGLLREEAAQTAALREEAAQTEALREETVQTAALREEAAQTEALREETAQTEALREETAQTATLWEGTAQTATLWEGTEETAVLQEGTAETTLLRAGTRPSNDGDREDPPPDRFVVIRSLMVIHTEEQIQA